MQVPKPIVAVIWPQSSIYMYRNIRIYIDFMFCFIYIIFHVRKSGFIRSGKSGGNDNCVRLRKSNHRRSNVLLFQRCIVMRQFYFSYKYVKHDYSLPRAYAVICGRFNITVN